MLSISLCPSHCCTVRRSTPAHRHRVAKVDRNLCSQKSSLSSKPADANEGAAESGVKNPPKMNVIARNQVIMIPFGLPHSQQSGEFNGDKREFVRRGKTPCPAIPKKSPRICYQRCLNRLYEGFLFPGAQSLVSLTWPRSMQRRRVPQCQLLTRAIHRGGP